MVDRPVGWRPLFKAGATFVKKLVIPSSAGDPAGVANQELWIDTNFGKLAFRLAGNTILVPLSSEIGGGGGLTQEQAEDIVATLIQDNSDFDWTYVDNGVGAGAITGVIKPGAVDYAQIQNLSAAARVLGLPVGAAAGPPQELTAAQLLAILGPLDAATLGGLTVAGLQTQIVNAISNGAGAAYDTLVEIQGLLQGEDSAITGLTTAVGLRSRFYAGAIPVGATPQNVVHGMNLGNIGDYTYRTFIAATGLPDDFEVTPVDANTVSVSDESGTAIPAGRRIFMTFGA